MPFNSGEGICNETRAGKDSIKSAGSFFEEGWSFPIDGPGDTDDPMGRPGVAGLKTLFADDADTGLSLGLYLPDRPATRRERVAGSVCTRALTSRVDGEVGGAAKAAGGVGAAAVKLIRFVPLSKNFR